MSAKKTILVVDDNKLNRMILCRILASDGYDALEAENGREALEILQKPGQSVSLVLLDIVMPVMDGYAFLTEMNETDLIQTVPVIVTTGNEDDNAEIRCLEKGASDFLKKPYNAELVRHRVRSLLRLWDNAALINRLETDRLTGVYSKEFFFRRAEELLEANPKKPYYIIYADVDDFKLINIRYGNAAGDELLKYLAELCRKQAGKDGICGRLGGDTFAMLLSERPKRTQQQLGSAFSREFRDAPVKGFQIRCGVYPVADRSISVSDMCDRAKMAEASIKHQYGVYYAVYDSSMMMRALREHQLVDGMEEGLEKKQFVLYLQPKHCTETGAVAGAEALVRWKHPELGNISPQEFIPLFERNGFIARLDDYMLGEACSVLNRWRGNGLLPVPISVNVSRLDFIVGDLPERIRRCVDANGIPHALIHLEVTESAYTDNPQKIISDISALRDMGFQIEMDDFGSGYSSLNMLSELPIDILKLDMRFIRSDNDRIAGNKRNILSYIVSLSKWLQLPTVAEGVETREEYEQLKAMGCDLIQGYYFARPMPANDFEAYMREHPAVCNLDKPSAPAYTPFSDGAGSEDKPLILVAEDIEVNREIMKVLLQPYYRVATVEDGRAACVYLAAHRDELSCMLLDLLMPVMDGFQVLESMRLNGAIEEIPVVITTETGGNSELRALKLGAASFVPKPYNPEILLHHVKKAVEEREFRKMRRDYEFQRVALHERAYCDKLTGALSRNGLLEALKRFPAREAYAAIELDIDDLKRINMVDGYTAGDEAIRTVVKALKEEIRTGDLLARTGGDEFVILLRGMSDPEDALSRAGRLCEAVQCHMEPDTDRPLACSAGITLANRAESYDVVSVRLSEALCEAKEHHRGRCCLWNSGQEGG